MTEIEDQILTVYHFWIAEGAQGHNFSRYLNGLFQMMQEKYPNETAEALHDAARRYGARARG